MSLNFNNVIFETSFGAKSTFLKSIGPEFVFVGRSNVGKSSLINKVFNRKHLARVSATPGKTSTINFYRVDNVRFVDLPGYGYAKVSKEKKNSWQELINRYLKDDRDIGLFFQLVDIRHKPTESDVNMINYFIDSQVPFVVILTKADKLSKLQLQKRLKELKIEVPCGEQVKMIPFSSVTGDGIKEIRSIINEIVMGD